MTEGRRAGVTDRVDDAIDRVVRAWTAGEPSPTLRTRVLARLESTASRPASGWAWRPARLAAAVCVLLAVAVLTWLTMHPRQEPATPVDAGWASAPSPAVAPERRVRATLVPDLPARPSAAPVRHRGARVRGATGPHPAAGPASTPFADTLTLDRLPRLAGVELEPVALDPLHVPAVDIEPIVIAPLDEERPGRGGSRRP